MLKTIGLKIPMTIAFSAFCGMALAHSGATGVVKERMEAMKDIAAQMKVIGDMVKGDETYDAPRAALAASAIADHAGMMPALFPDGSNASPSEALPLIWVDWNGFTQSAEQLETTATALSISAKSAANANEISLQFAAVGKTCSSCHQDFRAPD